MQQKVLSEDGSGGANQNASRVGVYITTTENTSEGSTWVYLANKDEATKYELSMILDQLRQNKSTQWIL